MVGTNFTVNANRVNEKELGNRSEISISSRIETALRGYTLDIRNEKNK